MRLALVSLLLAGCAHTGYRAPLTCGADWVEVTSPHFRVRTDQPRYVAERTIRMLEETHAAFEKLFAVGMVSRPAEGRVDFIALDRREDFLALSSSTRAKPYFTTLSKDVEPQPTIVTWGQIGEDARRVVQHE